MENGKHPYEPDLSRMSFNRDHSLNFDSVSEGEKINEVEEKVTVR